MKKIYIYAIIFYKHLEINRVHFRICSESGLRILIEIIFGFNSDLNSVLINNLDSF